MKHAGNVREIVEAYLSKKLDSEEFGNIMDRGDMILDIDKLLSDLKAIKDSKILILYCYSLIEMIITFGLREHLFKHNVSKRELEYHGLDLSQFVSTRCVKQCNEVVDDILDGIRFERKRQYAARIFQWNKDVLGVVSDFQQLRNLVAHKYHLVHKEYLRLQKDPKNGRRFKYVLFNKSSILKNMIYLLRVDFIPSATYSSAK